jgi:type III secretion protein U
VSDKTEQPTPRRLRRAAEEGDAPISASASQALAFLCAVAIAPAAVVALAARGASDLKAAIAEASAPSPNVSFDGAGVATEVLVLAAPVLVVASVTAAVASFVQSGGAFSVAPLKPNVGRLDPFAGLRQVLSPVRLASVLRATLLGGAVAWIAIATLRAHAADLARSAGNLGGAAALAGAIGLSLAKNAAILGVLFAVVDVVIARRSWTKRLMMSRSEIDRERKETERSPEHDAARARAREEMLSAANVANVREASVVVLGTAHLAAALRYDEGDEAPVLVASGRGGLAARLALAADAYGVPVVSDEELVRELVELTAGAAIPEALYQRTAEILREVWDERSRHDDGA